MCPMTSKPVRLDAVDGLSIMSLVSFRKKVHSLLTDDDEVVLNVKHLKGRSNFTFDVLDLAKMQRLNEAERLSCCCCLSIRLMAPMCRVISETQLWNRRRDDLPLCGNMRVREVFNFFFFFFFRSLYLSSFSLGLTAFDLFASIDFPMRRILGQTRLFLRFVCRMCSREEMI